MLPGVSKHWEFSMANKGELITKISVIKNKAPGDFSVSDQGSQEIKSEIQAVKS